ncbi:unnamed protein product [marine sediment metagenome]|uniref:Uncharacterized protein n=1 Tax=marine sediment metagenome TaxID=412755 RepID=X0S7T8_9ZZZZ
MDDFKDKLFTYMNQTIRAGLPGLNVRGFEQLRGATSSLAQLIEDMIVFEAGEVGNAVQKEVHKAFNKVAADMEAGHEEINKRLDTMQEEISKLWELGREDKE